MNQPMTANKLTIETESLTGLHYAAIVLAAITGVIHLSIAPPALPGGLGIAFVLAGLGFFGGIALFLLNWRRPVLYKVGVVFVAVQIPQYVLFNWPDIWFTTGIVDKTVQLLLIIVLIQLWRTDT